MKLKIRLYGDPVLRQPTEPVTEFDADLEKFASEMVQTMIEDDGVGLAAPQVGVEKKFLVIGIPGENEGDPRRIYAMANPEIVEYGEEDVTYEEGCLSIPGIYEEVDRPDKIQVRYQDLKGEWVDLEAEGLLARVVQHEMDHLIGKLFVDYLPALKRSLLRGKLAEIEKRSKLVMAEVSER